MDTNDPKSNKLDSNISQSSPNTNSHSKSATVTLKVDTNELISNLNKSVSAYI